MRRRFERLPIHRKLVASALLITAVALAVVVLGLSVVDMVRYRGTASADAHGLAQVLAENSAAAVAFDQSDVAAQILGSVRGRELVSRACIYLPTGELFAAFARPGTSCPDTPLAGGGWMRVSGESPVTRNGQVYGRLQVERSLADLRDRLLFTSFAGLFLFGLAACVAYVMAGRVNAGVSRPISELAAFARDFTADDARDLPVIATAPDELGHLITAFGEMVSRVRRANEDLTVSNVALLHERGERELALERERASERRFRMLADGSPVLLWVNGLEGCEFVNRAYLEFVGLADATDVRGFDWSRFVHPDDRDEYLRAYTSAFEAGAPFQAEFRFLRVDGHWRWMRSEATARLDRGRIAGYVGATVDITERRRAEDALREADQRKDAFLAILAHELRNPLAPIRSGLELLRIAGHNPGTLERVRPILDRQVAHMVRLIDDLLDVSRVTSGKIQLQRQPTYIADIVKSAVDAHTTAIEQAGLRLTVALPIEPCVLDADPTRLVQVLSNLLNNATKFTPAGGTIALTAAVDDGVTPALIELRVSDTGIGIPPATLPHVFEFFVQGELRRPANSGLGIGLGLARQLVELHGGRITAESEGPGRGSIFIIRLPLLPKDLQPVRDHTTPTSANRLDGCRVLVIDDNVDAADMLADIVRERGGQARATYDGRSGLDHAATFDPHVVLLDVGMPGMDGYATCRALRARARTSPYIVAVTGFAQVHDRERALREGFDAHVTKPADPALLLDVLARRQDSKSAAVSGRSDDAT